MRESATRRGVPLLLLFHWTALDAAGVLLAYQWALGRWIDAALPPRAWFFLAAGIWLGYTADRFLDLVRNPQLVQTSTRHAFLARNRRAVTAAWAAVAGSVVVLAPILLGLRHLVVGALLVALASIYVALASGAPGGVTKGAGSPKRIAAAGLLTLAGAWWFIGDPEGLAAVGGLVVVAFAGAAWWNLRALQVASYRDRASRETAALVADGAVLSLMLALGALAP